MKRLLELHQIIIDAERSRDRPETLPFLVEVIENVLKPFREERNQILDVGIGRWVADTPLPVGGQSRIISAEVLADCVAAQIQHRKTPDGEITTKTRLIHGRYFD